MDIWLRKTARSLIGTKPKKLIKIKLCKIILKYKTCKKEVGSQIWFFIFFSDDPI